MKKFNKLLCLALAVLMLCAVLTGCGKKEEPAPAPAPEAAAPAEEAAPAKPLEGKHMVVAMNCTFAPFESVAVGADGKEEFVGFDVDLLKKMSEDLGFTYEITNMDFSGLVGAVQSGRADLIVSGISPTEERKQTIDFSIDYFFPRTSVIAYADSGITDAAAMEGKKISTIFGTHYEMVAQSIKDAELVSMNNSTAAIQELVSKRADCAIVDSNQAVKFCEQYPDLKAYVLPSDVANMDGGGKSYAIGMPKDAEFKDIINEEIQTLIDNGYMAELITQWMSADFVPENWK